MLPNANLVAENDAINLQNAFIHRKILRTNDIFDGEINDTQCYAPREHKHKHTAATRPHSRVSVCAHSLPRGYQQLLKFN